MWLQRKYAISKYYIKYKINKKQVNLFRNTIGKICQFVCPICFPNPAHSVILVLGNSSSFSLSRTQKNNPKKIHAAVTPDF
jgi:hypothetical protein